MKILIATLIASSLSLNAVAAENPDEARRLAEAHIMGQLARLTQVNLDLSAGAAAS